MSAEQVFKRLGPNFMTPDVLEYRESKRFVIELSEGTGFNGEPIYGVTVRTHEGERDDEADELSQVFFSLKEAEEHVEEVIAIGGGSLIY